MIGLAYHSEVEEVLGYGHWDEVMATMGFDRLLIIDPAKTYPVYDQSYASLVDMIKAYSDHLFVFMSIERSLPDGRRVQYLQDYVHPLTDVIYVVGANYIDLDVSVIRVNDIMLSVDTAKPNRGNHEFRSTSIGLILGYDRYTKLRG